MKSIIARILDALFPKNERVQRLEALNQSELRSFLPHSPQTPHSWMQSLFEYRNPNTKEFVWQIKYAGNPILTKHAGALLADEIQSHIEERGLYIGSGCVIVAIPASKLHIKEKGFNQTDALCKEIQKHIESDAVAYIPHLLIKTKEAPPQVSIHSKEARIKNLVNAFAVEPSLAEKIQNRHVFIIDDVLTTGSTLTEARRALIEAGAKSVTGLTLAH